MRSLFVCTGHRKDAICFLALTRRVAGTGAASPGDSARAGTLPCAGVAGRHALPRECRGARPFCGFSPPVVYQGGGRVWGGSSSSDHAQSCGRWRLCRVPDNSGRQGGARGPGLSLAADGTSRAAFGRTGAPERGTQTTPSLGGVSVRTPKNHGSGKGKNHCETSRKEYRYTSRTTKNK